ncbi:hypothetical protein LV457_00265 [Mycobacterium sp. MYCO198283]|uniref:hypothetical protein n=1 Tax=Mycobacterium sp. MYCO198283 TaxID=2883505 RepID=UPI001E2DC91F|nr:hypothetical protein [Mycobacterium sp. MYCO198283]MCG5430733.1 hypothetical protein [Mycobacterium sp. MYCO198283]
MARREIDRNRARGARDVVRQHPGMVAFVLSPALLVCALVWWLAGAGWAILLLVVLLGAGGAALLRRR